MGQFAANIFANLRKNFTTALVDLSGTRMKKIKKT
jgi:hypothetical protein